jgi:lactoylglutathione lyase
MAIQDLAFAILYVEDMERETAFYRDVIGLPIEYATKGWVQFKTNGAALVLHPKLVPQKEMPRPANLTHIAFRVDDLDTEFKRLSGHQVKFHAPPATAGFGKHATCLDPEGNEIDLLEWAHRPPAAGVTADTVVNNIINPHPETMEVFENHGIRICGGCLVLLNAPVYETAEFSGLNSEETSVLVQELNDKLAELSGHAESR